MLIVKNIGLCNIRIQVDTSHRHLIPAGGVEVELPDTVKKVSFFKTLVDNGSLVVVKNTKERPEKVEPEKVEPETTETEKAQ